MLRQLQAGEDYYVVIASEDGGAGGSAQLVLRRPARLTSRSLDRTGIADEVTGNALLRGSVTADRAVQVRVSGRLRQVVGDNVVQSWASRSMRVSTTAKEWRVVFEAGRPFRNGQARFTPNAVDVYDRGVHVAQYQFIRTTVTLR